MINFKDQTSLFMDAIFAVCSHVDFAISMPLKNGGDRGAIWIHPDRPAGQYLSNCDRSKAETLRAQFWAKNQADEASIFFRPCEGSPLILLDDVSPANAEKIALKYSTLTVQTSPNKCQCWVRTDKNLSFADRHQIQKIILVKFDGKADPGATSGKQVGRVAGFYNRKPKYSDNPPIVQILGVPFQTKKLLNVDEMLKFENVLKLLKLFPVASTVASPAVSSNTTSMFSKTPMSNRSNIATRMSGNDESIKEFSYALHSIRHGKSPEAIIENIRTRVEVMGRHIGDDADRYARLTVTKAMAVA